MSRNEWQNVILEVFMSMWMMAFMILGYLLFLWIGKVTNVSEDVLFLAVFIPTWILILVGWHFANKRLSDRRPDPKEGGGKA